MEYHDSGVKRVENVRALLMSFNMGTFSLRQELTGVYATKPYLSMDTMRHRKLMKLPQSIS
jgi:hypothetical protein